MSKLDPAGLAALIVAAGPSKGDTLSRALAERRDLLIAADGGAAACLAAGATPEFVVGDLDSLEGGARRRLEAAGVRFDRHPREKDETDLELALDAALRAGARRVLLIGALGGRLDHHLANLLLPAAPAYRGLRVEARDGEQVVRWLHGPGSLPLEGRAGDTVSLIPLGGPARGVFTEGLEWPLSDEELLFAHPRGVSNRLISPRAEVRIREGVLACVSPGPEEAPRR